MTVTQTQTNQSYTATSSGSGTYVVPQLPPGMYTVVVTKTGFGSFQQTGIILNIDQKAAIDPALKVGAEATKVEVTSGPAILQSEDSSIGLVIDAATIQNTPLNSHTSVIGLLQLAPGVQNSGS